MTVEEVIYSSDYQPDRTCARDVLAFILTPTRAFVTSADADEFAIVAAMLEPVRREAVRQWHEHHRRSHWS